MKRFFSRCIKLDSHLFRSIYNLSGKRALNYFFYIITKIADGWLYALLAGIFVILRTSTAILILPAFITAYVLETLVYYIIKKNVKRKRPFKKLDGIDSLVVPPDEFSFPSGHTAAATVFAVFCGSLFPQIKPLLHLYVWVVGFSRVYNGVHYPGDIFAGAALGILSAKIGLLIF